MRCAGATGRVISSRNCRGRSYFGEMHKSLRNLVHGASLQKALDQALKEHHGAPRLHLLFLIVMG